MKERKMKERKEYEQEGWWQYIKTAATVCVTTDRQNTNKAIAYVYTFLYLYVPVHYTRTTYFRGWLLIAGI